jgi:phage antirepressor YoqD-like protein
MNANVSIYQDSVKDSSGILTSESNEMGLSTIFNYNGNNVAFIKTSYGILINATDMARPYNKRPVDYLRQIYVNELVSTIVSQTHISEDQLVIKMRGSPENGGGTWLYEDVAIDFAQWLDVKFKVWCNSKIKELLTTGLVKLPNFNNPPEAARAWADEYEARMKAEKEVRLALEAKEKIEKEKRMVQAELNTAIDTIKENEPVIDMFKRSIPREGVLIRESSKYFEQFGYYIGIKNMYPLLQELKYVFRNERGRIEAYQSARNSGLVTYGSDPGDEYWEAKAVTVMITLKGFVKLEELSRKKGAFLRNMVGSRYDAPHCDYSDKGKAIRALTGDNRFTKDIDYKVFTQNGKNPTEGRSTIVYTITAFCVECLITRKER